MLRIAICDDDKILVTQIEEMLNRYLDKKMIDRYIDIFMTELLWKGYMKRRSL